MLQTTRANPAQFDFTKTKLISEIFQQLNYLHSEEERVTTAMITSDTVLVIKII